MSTVRQKKLAHAIVRNIKRKRPLTKGQLADSSGYSRSMATKNPKVLFNQKGVIEELKELGFHEDNAKRVVAEILNSKRAKPDTRIKAAQEVFKVSGTYAPEKKIGFNFNFDEVTKETIETINELKRIRKANLPQNTRKV